MTFIPYQVQYSSICDSSFIPSPLSLPQQLRESVGFELSFFMQNISPSLLYDGIVKRFNTYLEIVRCGFVTPSSITQFYHEQLFNQNTPISHPFQREYDMLLDWITFTYFRILFNQTKTQINYPNCQYLFMALESWLFKIRCIRYSGYLYDFLRQNHMKLISECEVFQDTANSVYNKFEYCIPFHLVTPIIPSSNVMVRNGFVLFDESQALNISNVLFYDALSRDCLDITLELPLHISNFLSAVSRRLPTLFTHSPIQSQSCDFGKTMKCEDVNKVMKFFPLCMYKIIRKMINGKNIKFDARHQIGVFFFHFGLPIEEWIKYLNSVMHEKMKSDRALAYYFRHLYGLKGSKIKEPMWGCKKVMEAPVGLEQYHGCPFDLSNKSIEQLEEELIHYFDSWSDYKSIDKGVVKRICKTATKGKCQKACCKLFKSLTFDIEDFYPVQSPNQYAVDLFSIVNSKK
ncbi:DNA primase large subunit [Entamoeba marina]